METALINHQKHHVICIDARTECYLLLFLPQNKTPIRLPDMAKGKHKVVVRASGPLTFAVVPTGQQQNEKTKITNFFTPLPIDDGPKHPIKAELDKPLRTLKNPAQACVKPISPTTNGCSIAKNDKSSILKNSPTIANGSVQNSKIYIARTSPPTSGTTTPKTPSRTKTRAKKTTTKIRRIRISPVNNRQLTEYFPIRRSCRQTRTRLMKEKQNMVAEILLSGKEDGLRVEQIFGKGRGVVASKMFKKGEFVVEYSGELIDYGEAKHREKIYAQDQNTGCYMYYFIHNNRRYCVDATEESGRLGRLINHSRNGNLVTKSFTLDGAPRLILVAKQDINCGEELLYDYGDRSKESLESHPWLAM